MLSTTSSPSARSIVLIFVLLVLLYLLHAQHQPTIQQEAVPSREPAESLASVARPAFVYEKTDTKRDDLLGSHGDTIDEDEEPERQRAPMLRQKPLQYEDENDPKPKRKQMPFGSPPRGSGGESVFYRQNILPGQRKTYGMTVEPSSSVTRKAYGTTLARSSGIPKTYKG